ERRTRVGERRRVGRRNERARHVGNEFPDHVPGRRRDRRRAVRVGPIAADPDLDPRVRLHRSVTGDDVPPLAARRGRVEPPADVTSMAVTPPDGMLSFLTLTNHFFSGAAPLSIGRSLYPAFASIANVIGFDLYPLQNWCRNDAFQSVYDAQRELDTLAAGKP